MKQNTILSCNLETNAG